MEIDKFLKFERLYKQQYYYKQILMQKDERSIYEHSDINEEYKKILSSEAELMNKLVEDKDISKAFSVYYYLLWNGYFSINNKFKYQTDIKEIDSNLALNVSTGKACCRNVAIHYDKLINAMLDDRRFILVGTRYLNEPNKISDNKKIKTRVKHSKKQKPAYDNIYLQNHAECFDTKKNMVYDPLHFNIQTMNYDNLNYDNFIGTFDLGVENVLGTDDTLEERLDTLEKRLDKSKLLAFVKKEKMSRKELKKLRDIGIEICEDNKRIINEHNKNMQEQYQYIKRKIKNY